MPPTREPFVPTTCPQCGEPVFRRGHARGVQRYYHRKAQGLECQWHGTDAIGADKDLRTGIPKASKLHAQKIRETKGEIKTYVITSAQNATDLFEPGWLSLQTYCKTNKATLLVIPYRYKNPTSMWSKAAETDDWWTQKVLPYLMGERVSLNKHLIILGDIMTQPTANRPLEGFETITGAQSGIIGHPKLELQTVPTPQAKLPKILTTTGSITKRNYIPSKAGKKGEFHHTYGAVVVEISGDRFYVRQINMKNDGSFCDLMAEYDGLEVRKYDRIPALVMGDTHVNVIDPWVAKATFLAKDSILATLKPEILVWHDVHDGTAKNHHERGRVFHEYVKYQAGQDNVEAEVERTFRFIDTWTPAGTKNIIVPSNHVDFLKEWLENADWKRDPANAKFYLKTALAIVESPNTRWTEAGVAIQDPFTDWGAKMLSPGVAARTTFLRRDQPYQIKGIEVSYHGDKGPNGVKGTRMAFGKIGVKTIIGHTHSPGITDGAYQVGTSSYLNLSYAAGSPSSWLHTHCVIYPNGKRSLINIIDGKWRA